MGTGAKKAMGDKEHDQSEVVSAAAEEPAEQSALPDRGRRRSRNTPKHLEASINMDELRELVGLITENGLTNFELEREGFRVKVGRGTFIEDQSTQGLLPGAAERQIAAGPPTGS